MTVRGSRRLRLSLSNVGVKKLVFMLVISIFIYKLTKLKNIENLLLNKRML